MILNKLLRILIPKTTIENNDQGIKSVNDIVPPYEWKMLVNKLGMLKRSVYVITKWIDSFDVGLF